MSFGAQAEMAGTPADVPGSLFGTKLYAIAMDERV